MKTPLIVLGVTFIIFGVISAANDFESGLLVWGGLGIAVILASGLVKDAKQAVGEKVKEINKTEEELFEQISNELENNQINKGLWTKAEAESDGDENKVRSIYIKLRHQKLTREL
jgi:hypothetical protein